MSRFAVTELFKCCLVLSKGSNETNGVTNIAASDQQTTTYMDLDSATKEREPVQYETLQQTNIYENM